MVLSGAESQSIIKSLKKRVADLSYNAGVAKDYSREIHYDPTQDKKESIKELDQIIKEINEITYYHFSEIHNVNKLKIANQSWRSVLGGVTEGYSLAAPGLKIEDSQSEDSQSEDSQSEDSQSEDSQSEDSQGRGVTEEL